MITIFNPFYSNLLTPLQSLFSSAEWGQTLLPKWMEGHGRISPSWIRHWTRGWGRILL